MKPIATPRVITPPNEAPSTLLVPFTEPTGKQGDVSTSKQPRQDSSDVSMLDTGVSSNENSIGANEDVQLLHSPPITAPPSTSSSVAPSLSEISVKFEEIKPSNAIASNYFYLFNQNVIIVFKARKVQFHYCRKKPD